MASSPFGCVIIFSLSEPDPTPLAVMVDDITPLLSWKDLIFASVPAHRSEFAIGCFDPYDHYAGSRAKM